MRALLPLWDNSIFSMEHFALKGEFDHCVFVLEHKKWVRATFVSHWTGLFFRCQRKNKKWIQFTHITTQPTFAFSHRRDGLFIVPFEMRFNFLNWIRSFSYFQFAKHTCEVFGCGHRLNSIILQMSSFLNDNLLCEHYDRPPKNKSKKKRKKSCYSLLCVILITFECSQGMRVRATTVRVDVRSFFPIILSNAHTLR